MTAQIEAQKSFDIPAKELVDTTRDQIANLLFRNPNETFSRSETVNQPMPHKQTFSIENTRELHRLQTYGLFQLWSRLVPMIGIEAANTAVFGLQISPGEVIYSTNEPRKTIS